MRFKKGGLTLVFGIIAMRKSNGIIILHIFRHLKHSPQHINPPAAHFLLRCRATSDFRKPSKLKRRLARRLAAATSARWLPLVRVSLLPRPSLSLRSWSSSESVARRAFSLLKEWEIKMKTQIEKGYGKEGKMGNEAHNVEKWDKERMKRITDIDW